jgi:hypothetical protein
MRKKAVSGLTGGSNSTVKTVIESCTEKILLEIALRVTTALLLRCSALIPTVVDLITSNHDLTSSSTNTNLSYERNATNMKPTTSMRIRASRFLTDRYAYRERPDYLIELVAFGLIIITAILSLANTL